MTKHGGICLGALTQYAESILTTFSPNHEMLGRTSNINPEPDAAEDSPEGADPFIQKLARLSKHTSTVGGYIGFKGKGKENGNYYIMEYISFFLLSISD